MTPKEMDEAFTSISAEIEPELTTKKKAARFGFDPIRGEKIRLDRPKK